MEYKILMPTVSAKAKKGTLCFAPLKKGDKVSKGDTVAEIETEKVVVAVESEKSGVFDRYLCEEGDEVEVGKAIAVVTEAENAKEN